MTSPGGTGSGGGGVGPGSTATSGGFFADSIYAQPGLTHQVRQFDRAPLTAESILSAVASPSPAAVAAEDSSQADAVATGFTPPSTTRAELTNNHDAYVNFFDSTSINRDYGSTG